MTRFNLPCRWLADLRLAVVPVLGFAVLICACPAQAFTPAVKGGSENTPLHLTSTTSSSHSSSSSSGGPSLTRTILGLLIVIAVIWGLAWVLRQVKSGREARSAGQGLSNVATLALGAGRTLHLVRAGREYLLVGSAEHGVVPIHRYSEQQAQELGLLDLAAANANAAAGGNTRASTGASRRTDRRAGGRVGGEPVVPGQRATGNGTLANALLDKLREWTVRR